MERPDLTILIPCYNEAKRVGATIDALMSYLGEQAIDADVLLIDDGSSDDTWAVLQSCVERCDRVRALRLHTNQGKGGALMAGVEASTGRRVLFFDADLSHRLSNIPLALHSLDDGADLVIGARDLAEGGTGYPLSRKVTSFAFNLVIDALLGLGIPDTQCGFKAFDGDTARALFSHLSVRRFGFDVELLYLAKRWGLIIERIPVEVDHQDGSTVRVFRDGLQMFGDVVRIRGNSRRGRYPDAPRQA